MNNSYKGRHEESLASAILLNKNHLHPNSVHCSYYAAFQLLLCIIKINRYSHKDMKDVNGFAGSHDRTINFMMGKLAEIDQKSMARANRSLRSLKMNRTKADYEEVHMDSAFSGVCISLAQNLCQILEDNFLK